MYHLENLSPQDFEELCCDILQNHFKLDLERFKQGKDKGIDLRYLEDDESQIVIQVKHTTGSYSASHRSSLKKEYCSFLKHKHKFSRYILITSAKLSGVNKKEIIKIFNGIIKSEKDIFGYEFIEDFLRNHPKILKQHYKLWLSDSETISLILHSRVHGKSEDYLSALLKRKNFFVQTSSLSDGLNLLKKNRVLLLLGDPGVGKTFHAELICLSQITKGYEFIYAECIDEAENVFDKTKKQIFFIDDFLGANFLELFKENTENKILRFINRIQASNEKYAVFCSRTTIFNSAIQRSIHLENKHLEKKRLLLEISTYSDIDKAKILYNHLVYKNLDDKYLNLIKETKIYLYIVRHKNFNPRLIEFITSVDLIEDYEGDEYLSLIRYYLDNPSEIWHSAFENQLNNESRWLLQTLFTHGGICEEATLKETFGKRLQHETSNSNHVPTSSPYENSIKILLNGFITRKLTKNWGNETITTEISFRNPSISDYMLKYFITNSYPLDNTITSCCYFSQLNHILESNILGTNTTKVILEKIFTGKLFYKHSYKKSFAEEFLSLIILSNFNVDLSTIIAVFKKATKENKNLSYEILNETFSHLIDHIPCKQFIKYGLNIELIFYVLLRNIDTIDSIFELIETAKIFNFDIMQTHLTKPTREIIDNFHKVCDSEADSMLADDDNFHLALSPIEVEYAVDSVAESLYSRVSEFDFLDDMELDSLNVDCEDMAIQNQDAMRDDDDFFTSSGKNTRASNVELIRVFSN